MSSYTFDHVFLEITNRCNMGCSFCPSPCLQRKREDMAIETIKKVIDEISENKITQCLSFHLLGEPLLNPHLFEAIEHAVEKGLKTFLITNAILLNPENIEKILKANPFKVILSLQTPNKDDFAKHRGTKFDYDKYLVNIYNFLRRKLDSNNDTIVDIDIATDGRPRKLRKFLGLSNAPVFSISENRTFDGIESFIRGFDVLKSSDAEIKKYLDRLTKKRTVEIAPKINICLKMFQPWEGFYDNYPVKHGRCPVIWGPGILVNGDVVLCCGDYESKTAIGNVHEKSFMDIIEGAKSIFESHKNGKMVKKACQSCQGAPTRRGAFLRGNYNRVRNLLGR